MPTKTLTGPLWQSLIRIIPATGPPLSSRYLLSPSSLISLSLFRSPLSIARCDDTLPAGDKGSRARGRAKLEMLIPGIAARETGDGRGEAGVSYETVLILSFIPTRISEPETGEEWYRQRDDGCAGARCCCLLLAATCTVAAVGAATGCMRPVLSWSARGVRFDPWTRLGKNISRAITVWNCCLLGRRSSSSDDRKTPAWWIYSAEISLRPRGRLELVRDSLGAARFNTASSNIYGAGRSGIAE